jgi:hypothetical protein
MCETLRGNEKTIEKFFAYAVSLGADKATWLRSQFVRMPDGLRDNGRRQVIYYFDRQLILERSRATAH